MHGGKRSGAGRKNKAKQMGLPEILDKSWPIAERILVFQKLSEMARTGNTEAIKLLAAYTFGKPTEKHEHSGGVVIKVVNESDN